jgi:hypothetical protein
MQIIKIPDFFQLNLWHSLALFPKLSELNAGLRLLIFQLLTFD